MGLPEPVRALLASGYPTLLWALLSAWAALLWSARRDLGVLWRGLGGRSTAALLALALASFAAARAWTPAAHRVFEDEFEHIDIAKNVLRLGAFGESLAAGREGLEALALPTWPGLHHAALALAFIPLRSTEGSAFLWSALLSGAAVALLFLLALALFRSREAAFASAWLLALHPLHLRYAAATDLTPVSVLAVLAALLALVAHAQTRSRESHSLLLVSLLLAAHARFENVLLVPLSFLYLHSRGARLWRAGGWRLALSHAAFGLALLPLALLALHNRAAGLPGFAEGPASTLGHLARHLPGNLEALAFGPGGLPVLVLALAGLAAGPRPRAGALLALSGAYLLAYSAFFRGDLSAAPQDRYALAAHLPWLLLAGGGAAWLKGLRPGGAALSAVVLALAPLLAAPHLRSRPMGLFAEEASFLRRAAEALPAGTCLVSYSVPLARVATGRCAVSPYLLLDAPDPAAWERDWAPLAFFEDEWARRRRDSTERLRAALEGRWRLSAAARMGEGPTVLWRLEPREPSGSPRAPGSRAR